MRSIEGVASLGVGIVYFSELQRLGDVLDLADYDVLEIEPQTFWSVNAAGRLHSNAGKLASLAEPGRCRLVHSVGLPVGGALAPDDEALALLAENAALLGAPYVSEHLSFNRVATQHEKRWAGFLLPPPQTLDGVAVAVARLRELEGSVNLPVAFETGVNYFPARPGEFADGDFFASVARYADCGILLDLHNLLANERNGRSSVASVIEALPLDRVWEVHVAGGHFHRGYYLDAHDGLVSSELRELTERVVPLLPNLRAIVFEAQPDSLRSVTRSQHDAQREWLQRVWDRRGMRARATHEGKPRAVLPGLLEAQERVAAYEREIVANIDAAGGPAEGDRDVSASVVLRELIGEARGGMLLRSIPLVLRLLMTMLGSSACVALLERYCSRVYPAMFALSEAAQFLRFIESETSSVPFLRELIDFEWGVLSVIETGEPCRVHFPYNPAELFSALARRSRPSVTDRRPYDVEVERHAVTLHACAS